MVVDSGFEDQLHLSAKRGVALLQNRGVLQKRHGAIGITTDAENRDLRRRDRLQVVDRVQLGVESLLLGLEAVIRHQLLPIARRALALALSSRPALEIANGGIEVNDRHALGMTVRPVHRIEPTPAEPEEAGLLGHAIGRGDVIVKTVHQVERRGTAEAVFQVDVAEMEALAEQGAVGLIEGLEKFRSPDPGFARCRGSGLHHPAVPPFEHEAFLFTALPLAAGDGDWRLGGKNQRGKSQDAEEDSDHDGVGGLIVQFPPPYADRSRSLPS